MMDCYAVLGVQEDASQAEIKQAFRERALECHPDRADDGEEDAAKEEFLRVRKAFELLSDPRKRAAYDAGEEGEEEAMNGEEPHVRRRSYQDAWRQNQAVDRDIHVSQIILDRVNGLSADYDLVQSRTSITVPVCALLGMVLFLYEPGAIYASDIFLVDLFLCTAIGGIYGYLIGSAWGYADVYFGNHGAA